MKSAARSAQNNLTAIAELNPHSQHFIGEINRQI